MLRVKLPIEYSDGKDIHSAALALIGAASPAMAKYTHQTQEFNPFSTILPDQVCILEPSIEFAVMQLPNIKILNQVNYRECFTGDGDEFIVLRFQNTFFRNGQTSYPLPDPWMMIKSWKQRWNSLVPDRISLELPIYGKRYNERVQIRYTNISTQRVLIADYRPYYAFSGVVKLKWIGSERELRDLWALARFAEFSGSGAKTTMGCGVTKILGRGDEK